MRGRLIVISGPSGVGKDCVLCEMRRLNSDTLVSVSATTRLPRSGEVDGKDYYFFSKQDFENKIKNNEFIEYATYCGNYYGTLKFPLEKNLVSGKDVILKIEVQGATKIRMVIPECLSIFIVPPSIEVLKKRILTRGSNSDKEVDDRLKQVKIEMIESSNYDYVVVNDKIDVCARKILKIINNIGKGNL